MHKIYQIEKRILHELIYLIWYPKLDLLVLTKYNMTTNTADLLMKDQILDYHILFSFFSWHVHVW